MVVPPTPIVPGQKDRGVVPILARADRIDDGCDPGGPGSVGKAGMIRRSGRRGHPRDVGEVPGGDIREHLGGRSRDVGRKFVTLSYVPDGVGPIPDAGPKMLLIVVPG